jgi:hypothetical protein
LEELTLIVKTARDKEMRGFKFAASLKGIDLDSAGSEQTVADKVEEMKRREEARRAGKSDEEFEFDEFGLEIIKE